MRSVITSASAAVLCRSVRDKSPSGGFPIEARNVVLLGPPGTGETHLTTALGVAAARQLPQMRSFNWTPRSITAEVGIVPTTDFVVGNARVSGMTERARLTPLYVTALLAVVGVALIVVAVVYFAEPAGSLPSYFPGHLAGSHHHHTTHGLAALIVGLIGIVGAWMSAGRRNSV